MEKISLGVSACLLGHSVRHNGGHARDRYVADVLSRYFEFTPVCPEVEAGFPVPRKTFRLIGDPDAPRMIVTKTEQDVTSRMQEFCARRVEQLADLNLCGFIFKSRSPSSGMQRVKVYDKNNVPRAAGTGLFARAFMDRFPLVPVEDEGRLNDPGLRENFIEAVFTLKRWRDAAAQGMTRRSLVDFHTEHKLLLMSHSPRIAAQMGKLTAAAKDRPISEVYNEYPALLMRAMRLKTTVKKNVNVLDHAMGYFKKQLTSDEKAELKEVIGHYHAGFTPLVVPVTLINHYVRKYDQAYLKRQWYLNPHPAELKLRNHA